MPHSLRLFLLAICLSLLSLSSITNANANATSYIDLRTSKQDLTYAVSLVAEKPRTKEQFGHAYVVWYREDPKSQRSVFQAAGFYPEASGKKGYDLLLQLSSGKVYDDSNTKRDIQLVVLLDSSQYEKTRSVIAKWSDPAKRYGLLLNDCVSFLEEVATRIGLNLPSRLENILPADYVKALITANGDRLRQHASAGGITRALAPINPSASPLAVTNTNQCRAENVRGSYQRSCFNCRVVPRDCLGGACDRLECTCKTGGEKRQDSALYLFQCNECQFWNNKGFLQCGDG